MENNHFENNHLPASQPSPVLAAPIALAAAGCLGALGLICLAASSHLSQNASQHDQIQLAGLIFTLHAPAMMATALCLHSGLLPRRSGLVFALGLAIGAVIFGTDMLARGLLNHALFPMAAPLGGSVLIISWLGLMLGTIYHMLKNNGRKATIAP